MKICVFGAGSVGGYLAGSLRRGGNDVSVIARGAHLAAIRANGLTVETPDSAHGGVPDDRRLPRLDPEAAESTRAKAHPGGIQVV